MITVYHMPTVAEKVAHDDAWRAYWLARGAYNGAEDLYFRLAKTSLTLAELAPIAAYADELNTACDVAWRAVEATSAILRGEAVAPCAD